ncbi:MAG: SOS response-associated peptidase [Solirubrobacterales bacterium]|nr:SOS response-associated peptidase [Solirubrobacterales bacterium]
MCGRFTLTDPSPRRLTQRFDLDGTFEIDERPRFNIAPTDPVIAIRRSETAKNQAGRLRWGLVPGFWAEKKGQRPLINARAESVATQPAFRESFEQRRCLIPADGFYEWRTDESGKRPIWFSPLERELFAFAGIWSQLERKGSDPLTSCALITTTPNAMVGTVHDRMPVVLERAAESAWLDPDAGPNDLLGLLRPAPDGFLEMREVGDAVNNAREDGPHLLEPPLQLF